jgi:Uma2 family endonuclease
MVQTATRNLTFEEYLTCSDGTDNRYELADGELLLMTPNLRSVHRQIIQDSSINRLGNQIHFSSSFRCKL